MSLSTDVVCIIAVYLAEYRFLDWIDISKINWYWLCTNPAAIDLLNAYPENINWGALLINPAAMNLLKNHDDRRTYSYGMDLFSNEKIQLRKNLVQKPKVVTKLHRKKINWDALDDADGSVIKFLVMCVDNPDLYKSVTDIDKTDWRSISMKSTDIELLKANQDKIDWNYFSRNPIIFELKIVEQYVKILLEI